MPTTTLQRPYYPTPPSLQSTLPAIWNVGVDIVRVNPARAILSITGFASTISFAGDDMLTPTPAAITIAAYAPTVPNPNTILSPLYAAVTIVTWEPSISTS